MIGSLISLRDWLADQLAEIRHTSPLAVLATPDTLTETDYALAPGFDTEPCCEWATIDDVACDTAAAVRVRLHCCGHNPPLALLCQPHMDEFVETWTGWLALHDCIVCGFCRTPFRHLSDVLKAVIPL